MTKNKFTPAESNWLVQLINERIALNCAAAETGKHAVSTRKTLQYFLSGQRDKLTPYENALTTGCVNETMGSHYDHIQAVCALDLLHPDEQEKASMSFIDMGKDILQKLGFEKRTHFPTHNYATRYRDSLLVIEKLKHADTICLSCSQQEVYKLNLVYRGKEQFQWKMSRRLGVFDLQLYPLQSGEAMAFPQTYSVVTNRKRAAELMAATKVSWYHENTLRFFNEILN